MAALRSAAMSEKAGSEISAAGFSPWFSTADASAGDMLWVRSVDMTGRAVGAGTAAEADRNPSEAGSTLGRLGLSMLAGPANAGKVALLLERYLARLDDEPFLIVPNRSDVDRVERDLQRRAGCLLGGAIGTFDDLFARIAEADPERRPVATDAQRALIVRRAVRGASLN